MLSKLLTFLKPAKPLASPSLEATIQEIPNHIAAAIIIRSTTGAIQYANSYIEVLTGYPLSYFANDQSDYFREVVHDKDKAEYDRCLAVAAAGEQFEQTLRIVHQAGLELFVEIRAVPIFHQEGQIESIMLVALNVTGNIRYQKTIEEKNRDLADFTLMLSHDLKAPIFSIKGFAPIVGESLTAQATEAREALLHITNATNQLERLINGVLEYARVTESELEVLPVDLELVLNDSLASFRLQLDEIKANVQLSKPLPIVRGDRLRLGQIFSNLISNSIKYRDSARPLTIDIRPIQQGKHFVDIKFSDNGIGIPSAKLKMIFRPFQRAHGAHIEGAGIGLALVKRLITRLGGEVSIESQEGIGTSFILSLQRVMSSDLHQNR